jgi:PAS domain S-box-containing protein
MPKNIIPIRNCSDRECAIMENILSTIPLGICYVHERKFIWVNAFMTKITGYSYDEMIGKSTRMLYESDEEFKRVGREIYKNTTGVLLRGVRKDGGRVIVMLHSISNEMRTETGTFMLPHVLTVSEMPDELIKMIRERDKLPRERI